MRLLQQEFSEVRDRLYPMLMDPVQIQEKGEGQMVNGAIAQGLIVIYAIEEPDDKVRYVTYQDLRDWGVSQSVVHVTAMRNLERTTTGKRVTKLDSAVGGHPMYIWHLEDGYDAARVLLTDWLDDFAQGVSGNLLVGIPHRNWLVAIGDDNPELVRVVRRRIMAEHHSADFPVSPYLYIWTGEKLERLKGGGAA